jgi:thiosulfate reductase cytochrome b subunit
MKKVVLHSLPIRIWHWSNALIVIILLVTGTQLRVPALETIPKYSQAVWIHKYVGFAMAASFLFWLVYVALSRSFWRHYLLRPVDLRLLGRQAFYYIYGIFRGSANPFKPAPEGKFNPLQKIAYSSVMLLLTPVVVVTGILFSDIFFFRNAIHLLYGVRALDALHVAAGYLFLIYLLVHLYMSTLGHHLFSHTKAMILGYEEEPD